jgi:hypothetical protein
LKESVSVTTGVTPMKIKELMKYMEEMEQKILDLQTFQRATESLKI